MSRKARISAESQREWTCAYKPSPGMFLHWYRAMSLILHNSGRLSEALETVLFVNNRLTLSLFSRTYFCASSSMLAGWCAQSQRRVQSGRIVGTTTKYE